MMQYMYMYMYDDVQPINCAIDFFTAARNRLAS